MNLSIKLGNYAKDKIVDIAYKHYEKELMLLGAQRSKEKFIEQVKEYLLKHDIDSTDVNKVLFFGLLKYEKGSFTLKELIDFLDDNLNISVIKK